MANSNAQNNFINGFTGKFKSPSKLKEEFMHSPFILGTAQKVGEIAGGIATNLAEKYSPKIINVIAQPIVDRALENAPEAVQQGAEKIIQALTTPVHANEIGNEGSRILFKEAIPAVTQSIVDEHTEATKWAASSLNPENLTLKQSIEQNFGKDEPFGKRIFGKILFYGGRLIAFISAKLLSIMEQKSADPTERKRRAQESEEQIQLILSGAVNKGLIPIPAIFDNKPVQNNRSQNLNMSLTPQPA